MSDFKEILESDGSASFYHWSNLAYLCDRNSSVC